MPSKVTSTKTEDGKDVFIVSDKYGKVKECFSDAEASGIECSIEEKELQEKEDDRKKRQKSKLHKMRF